MSGEPTDDDAAHDAHVTPIEIRFSDLDTMGHVNNAVYVTYLEQARVAYVEDALDRALASLPSVVASLSIEYHRPITGTGDATVLIRVPELGQSSLPMEYEIHTDGELMATAETVQVFLDEHGDPQPIPAAVRDRITEHESYQGD